MADGSGHHGASEHAEALESQEHLGHAMGQLGGDESAADAQRGEVGLVAEALDELGGSGKK